MMNSYASAAIKIKTMTHMAIQAIAAMLRKSATLPLVLADSNSPLLERSLLYNKSACL